MLRWHGARPGDRHPGRTSRRGRSTTRGSRSSAGLARIIRRDRQDFNEFNEEQQREAEKARPVCESKRSLDIPVFEARGVPREKLDVIRRYMSRFAEVAAPIGETRELLKNVADIAEQRDVHAYDPLQVVNAQPRTSPVC